MSLKLIQIYPKSLPRNYNTRHDLSKCGICIAQTVSKHLKTIPCHGMTAPAAMLGKMTISLDKLEWITLLPHYSDTPTLLENTTAVSFVKKYVVSMYENLGYMIMGSRAMI